MIRGAASSPWVEPTAVVDRAARRWRHFLLTGTVLAIVPLYLAMAVSTRHEPNHVPAVVELLVALGMVLAAAGAMALFRAHRVRDAVALVSTLVIAGGVAAAVLEVNAVRASVALLGGALGVMYVAMQARARSTVKAALGHTSLVVVVALTHPVLPVSAFVVPVFGVVLFSVMGVAGAAFREAHERQAVALQQQARLRVPLANVVAHLEYLEDQLRSALPLTTEAELKELLEKISVEGRSLLGAVQEWVALAHAGEGAHVTSLEVDAVFAEVLQGLSTVLADRGLLVQREGDRSVRVWAVESLLAHVLLHLVLHAAAARDPGERVLVVRVTRQGDGQVTVAAGPPGAAPAPEVKPEALTLECLCQAMARSLGGHCHTFRAAGGQRYEVHLRGAP